MGNQDQPQFEDTAPVPQVAQDPDAWQDPDAAQEAVAWPSPASVGQQPNIEQPPQFEDTSAAPDESAPAFEDTAPVEQFQTPGQEALGEAEAVGRGFAGPVFTGAERLLGASQQGISGRQAALGSAATATEAASFVGSMFLGTGEAAALAKLGEAAADTAKATGVASTFIKGAVEGGAFLGGDKISQSLMGTEDPNETVSSALLQTGAAAILGGTGGVAFERLAGPALAKIGESNIGTKVSQFMSDLGSALSFEHENPDLVEATTNQINNVLSANESARDELYGSGQLYKQNIGTLTQDVTNEQLNDHIDEVRKMFADAPAALQDSAAFQDIKNQWESRLYSNPGEITPPATVSPNYEGIPETVLKAPRPLAGRIAQMGEAGSAAAQTNLAAANAAGFNPYSEPAQILNKPEDIFLATNSAKQRINSEIAKFGARTGDKFLQNTAQSFYGKLADTLEDSSIWNKAGDFQSQLNSAVSDFIPKNTDFLKRFTENFSATAQEAEDGMTNKIARPNAVKTYLNQAGDVAGANKRQFVQRWAEGSQQFQQQVNAIHQSFGIDSPMITPPMDLITRSYGEMSPGAQAARSIYQFGFKRAAQSTLGTIWGGEEGYRRGGVTGAVVGGIGGGIAGAIAPHIENLFVGGLRKYGVPVIVKALSSGAPEATGAALNYAAAAAKGASKLSSGINSLFEYGGTKAIEAAASDSDKDKIHQFVNDGSMDDQLQAQISQPSPAQAIQGYADGGEVAKPEPQEIPQSPAPPALKSVKGIAKIMPDHAAMLAGAKVRVSNYLNSIRPQKNTPKLAFDDAPSSTAKERSYQKALELAAAPLGILNHMKTGTLTPELLGHFKSMWPEIHSHISKEITGKITEAQLNGEKPPYRVRQSMSLFLGAPLDGTFTPQAIQSIQAMYAGSTQQTPPPGVPPKRQKKNTSKLGEIPKDHYTQDQAATQRTVSGD